jgi:hypothetical protein
VFWDTLLNAAVQNSLGNYRYDDLGIDNNEGFNDRAFNFRMKGLNADMMSYSMLHLANNDPESLLEEKHTSSMLTPSLVLSSNILHLQKSP